MKFTEFVDINEVLDDNDDPFESVKGLEQAAIKTVKTVNQKLKGTIQFETDLDSGRNIDPKVSSSAEGSWRFVVESSAFSDAAQLFIDPDDTYLFFDIFMDNPGKFSTDVVWVEYEVSRKKDSQTGRFISELDIS